MKQRRHSLTPYIYDRAANTLYINTDFLWTALGFFLLTAGYGFLFG